MAYFPTPSEARQRDGFPPEDEEGDEAFGRELERERPHAFVRKNWRRRGAGGRVSSEPSRNITLAEYISAYSAADFALASGLPLDVHVTLNFPLLGIWSPGEVQDEIDRFLKNYGAYASGKFPAAWLYSVEMGTHKGALGYHAHIALHVPGVTPETEDAPPRRAFRKWVRDYSDRLTGEHVPRATKVSCSLKARPLAHWLTVTYLLKGCDEFALVQSARSSIDGWPLQLRDLMPWPYADPGPVATTHRIRSSHSLGPKRRAFGAPTGMDHILPQKPDLRLLVIDGGTGERDGLSLPTVAEPKPFLSKFEDGVRDVRELYSHEFYRHVTRREPYEPTPSVIVETECFTCQLRRLADVGERQYRNGW